MTPWITGFVRRDQLFSRAPHFKKKSQLPWQSFEADRLYATIFVFLVLTATIAHNYVIEGHLAGKENFVLCEYVNSFKCLFLTAGLTALLGIVPCLACFVLSVYAHALECSPEDNSGDCTRFVKFRDAVTQEKYRGKRIDMESLYEMYFDEKLDFISPRDREGAPEYSRDPCLMKDILSRRDEFVSYTFGLTTHLKFLALKWVPDVLSHSKKQDLAQVRDHYDRSKYYAQNVQEARSQPTTPFTSDKAEDDFFGMFLGEAMVYTSGISPSLVAQQQQRMMDPEQQHKLQQQQQNNTNVGEESVEAMQDCKLKLLCKKMRMQKGDFHLDIGCGWGTLVNFAAANYGTIGTGVTLSRNQAAYAAAVSKKKKIRDHRTTFWCCDYRDIPTNVGVRYNKISCIEMAEHVGVKNFLAFLNQVRELLEDDGIFLLQIAGLRRAFQVLLPPTSIFYFQAVSTRTRK